MASCLDIDFAYLNDHIVPGPQSASYFIPLILPGVALLIPPGRISHGALCGIFLPIIIAAVLHAWYAMGAIEVISADCLFWSIYLLAVQDPRQHFTRFVRRENSKPLRNDDEKPASNTGYDEVRYPKDFLSRLSWVGTLSASLRLTDWRIGEPAHDRRQPFITTQPSATRFIALCTLRGLFGFLVFDVAATLIRRDPYFTDLSLSIFDPPNGTQVSPSDMFTSLRLSTFRSLLTAAEIWSIMSQVYCLPQVVPVILHSAGLLSPAWTPHLLPPFFGPWTAVMDRGLRGFWSTYWHQTMRFVVAGPGILLARWLVPDTDPKRERGPSGRQRPQGPEPDRTFHLPPEASERGDPPLVHDPASIEGRPAARARTHGSSAVPAGPRKHGDDRRALLLAREAILTASAFTVSGFIHMGMVPRAPLHSTVSPTRIRLLLAAFFWVQPLGLLFERTVLARCLAGASGAGTAARWALNAAFIALWSALCFPLVSEAMRQLGLHRYFPLPWSPVGWAMGGSGWMWPCLG